MQEQDKAKDTPQSKKSFRIEKLEERIAPCGNQAPPFGTCPPAPPGIAPGNSNPPGGK